MRGMLREGCLGWHRGVELVFKVLGELVEEGHCQLLVSVQLCQRGHHVKGCAPHGATPVWGRGAVGRGRKATPTARVPVFRPILRDLPVAVGPTP